MEQATTGQIQNQNQRQPQSNRQAIPATGNSQPDELKGLGMMMQQLLQGMQIHGKALNQVSTDINTRMDNMFTELNTRAAQTHQMFSYEWGPCHRQSASYSISYDCFTEEWSVCLARGSCRGDKGRSIDGAPLPSIYGDARIWAEHILRATEA
ncbi:hypothetical protein F2Q70_00003091 [Brassica cretica]|uniref:Uncharacterized protein n=1 Tax=Brassica cretica TaxID=69181 RepID=A0A8S9J385_BRACR|nr:hypothetical protein F2Q70_00003091 [Brassica cretica]